MEKKEIVPIQIVDRNPPMTPTALAKSKLAARVKLGQTEAYIYNGMETYQLDVFDNALFLFCGSRSDRFKALYWEGDGFILLYKRFENERLQWAKHSSEIKQLDGRQLKRLLTGFSIEEKKTIHLSTKAAFYYFSV